MGRRLAGMAVALALAAGPALAITWMTAERPDPFKAGAKCPGVELGSMGSYVFSYPSKYDAVYHPWVENGFIWRCPASGFVSFADDFDKVPDTHKPAIAAWLAANPAQVKSLSDTAVMDRLEAIYRLRDMPPAFWDYFYRVRAYRAETAAEADGWRARSLVILKQQLGDPAFKGFARMRGLYLVGFYERRAGDRAASDRAFAAMKDVDLTGEENADNIRTYLNGLAADVQAGRLDGDCVVVRGGRKPGCPALADD